MTILQATNIRKSYGTKKNRQEVLKGIDLRIEKAEFVSIMGASGSGKTTLLNVLSSIDYPSEGEITIDGTVMTKLREKQLSTFRKEHLGFIFQDYHLLDTLTVKENILLPLSIANVPKKEAQERFAAIAGLLGIEPIGRQYPNEISGGQKQRAAAARAFIHQPSMIFADEPTGALDSKSASDLLNKLTQLNKEEQATILMVTHDPTAASYSDRVIFIQDGQIYSQLHRGDQAQSDYFREIMKMQSVLGGIHHEHA